MTLKDFADQLDDFWSDYRDESLRAAWDAMGRLDAPTIACVDGEELRPFHGKLLIGRFMAHGKERFELLEYQDIKGDEVLGSDKEVDE